jgi:hypothetical protein
MSKEERERRDIVNEYPPRASNTELTLTIGSVTNPRTFTYSSPHQHFARGLNSVMMVLPDLINRISPETPEVYASQQNVVHKVANYTATPSDYLILCDTSAGAFAVSLPSAINVGLTLVIVKTDSSGNAVTIAPFGNDTIQGAASKSLSAQYDKIILTADGVSNWIVETENLV